jgi:hypothetical protein
MRLSQVYLGMGQEDLGQLLSSISLGKLKTYQMFEPLKLRLHLTKLNSETLRRSAQRVWPRLEEGDEDLAKELAQAILISHMDMIVAVLDELGIPHQEGFFDKDLDASKYLTDGWQQRVYEKFRGRFPGVAVRFYLNHLAFDLVESAAVFTPAS